MSRVAPTQFFAAIELRGRRGILGSAHAILGASDLIQDTCEGTCEHTCQHTCQHLILGASDLIQDSPIQVDIVALNIPDYAEIIKKPMHLYAITDGLAVSFPFSMLPLFAWFLLGQLACALSLILFSSCSWIPAHHTNQSQRLLPRLPPTHRGRRAEYEIRIGRGGGGGHKVGV